MTSGTINLLLVEDNPDDADLLQETLAEVAAPHFVVTHVERLNEALQHLVTTCFDVILLDLSLPDSFGLETLVQAHQQAPNLPMVVLTGNDDKALAIEAVQAGAQDYLVKGWTDRDLLVRTTRYAIERKRTQEALRKSEMRFRTLIQENTDGIVIINQQGIIQFANPAAETLFERKVKALVGEPFNFPLSGVGDTTEFEITSSHGRTTVVAMRLVAMEWEGEPSFLASLRDITERKLAEEALAQQAQELTRSNTELEQFAYIASHDLQEPLRMISSYLQLLARRYTGQLDADADEFIGYAMDGASRMKTLIHDLLAYSRVGTQGTPFTSTDCQAILDDALNNLQVAIEESGAIVSHDPLPTVVADRSQLLQLFQNLIGNALKFRTDLSPRVHVSAGQDSVGWVFTVQDNGIGIDPEQTERIFFIFQRLHTKGDYSGTGIGLAVCKKIVERHGGHIWVESQPGQGSTFYFTLPAVQQFPV